MRLEILDKLEKFIRHIGCPTRDISTCSLVPQPTTLPHALFENRVLQVIFECKGNEITEFVQSCIVRRAIIFTPHQILLQQSNPGK
jgi:hypothetical protein